MKHAFATNRVARIAVSIAIISGSIVTVPIVFALMRIDENERVLVIARELGIAKMKTAPSPPWIANVVPESIATRIWPRYAELVTDIDVQDDRIISDEKVNDVRLLKNLRVLKIPNGQQASSWAFQHSQGVFGPAFMSEDGDRSSKITDNGVKHLESLPRLLELDLYGSKITDEALRSIAKIKTIDVLLLGNTSITDAGLRHLLLLPQLRILQLSGTRITNAAAETLGQIRTLEYVSVDRTAFRQKGSDTLRQALPHVEVFPSRFSLPLNQQRVVN